MTISGDNVNAPGATVERSVLIAIPCLNEKDHIESVVRTVLEETRERAGEVVVCDGGSTDGTVDILNRLVASQSGLTVLHNPARLQSAAVNLAVRMRGDRHTYLVRVDAHGGYRRGFVTQLVDAAERTGAESVVVGMDTVGRPGSFQAAAAAAQNSVAGNGGSGHRSADSGGRWVDHGHHALFLVSAFREVGGYDETFSHNEDAELDIRLRAHGFRIWLADEPRFTYYPRATPSGLAKQYFRFGRGRARTILRHRRVNPRQLVVAPVVPVLVGAGATRSKFATLPILAWALLCAAIGGAETVKARDLRRLRTTEALMVMHLSWSAGFWAQVAGEIATRISRISEDASHEIQ